MYMNKILNKVLFLLKKSVSFFVLLGILLSAYIFFNIKSFDILGISISNPIKKISSFVDDNLLYNESYIKHNNEVIIIKIDEKTLNSFSKSDIRMLSFPKELYSNLIKKLVEDYKVSVIGFDIVFSNKSYFGEDDENILRDTFDKYSKNVVVGTMSDNINKPLCKYNNVQHGSIGLILEPRIRKTNLVTDYKVGKGCDNLDNLYVGNKGFLESFPFVIYKKYIENLNTDIDFTDDFEQIKRDNFPFFYINFFHNGERNSGTIGFKSYSLIDILNGKDIDLEGKIVLVGEVGTVLHDSHYTPVNFKYKMPGVEINANLIMTFLTGLFLNDFSLNYLILIIFSIGLLIYFLVLNNNIIIGFVGFISIIFVNISFGIFAFLYLGLLYPVSMVLFFCFFIFFGLHIYKFVIVDKNKRFLKKAFSMYISSDMVNQISRNPDGLNLKGHKGDITVFFSDIASFTSISEKMEPHILFDFLNRYFNKMTQVLISNRGTLDKYIGDGIMGFFNAPLKLKNHEFFACKSALEQLNALKSLNQEFKDEGLPVLNIRIGINTGRIVHGNLGARGKRLNYTIIGDDVNLASRLESVNKIYGTSIIVSESVYNKVSNDFVFRELDHVLVKGKNKAVFIYELVGYKNQDYDKETLFNYSKGLKEYYLANYEKASEYFGLNKDDLASTYMIKRIKRILRGELKIIDGIYKMEKK
ncbi:hypothetical protein CSA08_03035 [Candidatus Gracilibacteria bacterium]|nr:MAG: hypothetical protein CSA08_03035 [Candidatus Gracilibacteria bacterium]